MMKPQQRTTIGGLVREYWFLFFILIVVLLLEIIYARQRGLWIDEFFSWGIAKRPLSDLFFLKDFHRWYMNSFPPLYEILVHFFLKLMPLENELTLRLPSVFFFLVSLILVYKLTLALSKKHGAALLAVFFTACNPAYFFYGGMLRMYLFLTSLYIASFILIYKFLYSHQNVKYLFWLGGIYLCMMYTSYISIGVIAIEILCLRIYLFKLKDKRAVPYLIGCVLVPFILFIPWLPNCFFDLYIEHRSSCGIPFFNKLPLLFINMFVKGNVTIIIHSVLFCVSVVCIFFQHKTKELQFLLTVLTLSLVLHNVLCFVLLKSWAELLYIRYFLPVCYIIFIFNSIYVFSQKNKRVRFCLCFILILTTVCSVFHDIPFYQVPTVKDIALYCKKYSTTKDRALFYFEDIMVVPGFFYYFAGPDVAYELTRRRKWGDIRRALTMYHNKNINVYANVVGASFCNYQFILKEQPDILCVIDIPFFEPRNYSNAPVPFNWGFSEIIEQFLMRHQIKYELYDRKSFRGYTLSCYNMRDN